MWYLGKCDITEICAIYRPHGTGHQVDGYKAGSRGHCAARAPSTAARDIVPQPMVRRWKSATTRVDGDNTASAVNANVDARGRAEKAGRPATTTHTSCMRCVLLSNLCAKPTTPGNTLPRIPIPRVRVPFSIFPIFSINNYVPCVMSAVLSLCIAMLSPLAPRTLNQPAPSQYNSTAVFNLDKTTSPGMLNS